MPDKIIGMSNGMKLNVGKYNRNARRNALGPEATVEQTEAKANHPSIEREKGPMSRTSEIKALIEKGSKGDKAAVVELKEMLGESPEALKWWRRYGDLAQQAEASILNAMTGKQLILREAASRTAEAMRTELAGQEPSPIETLLAERITLCWIHLNYAETIYAQNMGEMSMKQAEFHQRRISHCHQRYLSAIRTLAMVRRLLRPPVAQINIAEQQVNIAGNR